MFCVPTEAGISPMWGCRAGAAGQLKASSDGGAERRDRTSYSDYSDYENYQKNRVEAVLGTTISQHHQCALYTVGAI